MKILLDANILIQALLGSRAAITILTSQNHAFYAPTIIVASIQKYKTLICERSGQSPKDFETTFDAIQQFITLVEEKTYQPFLKEAQKVFARRDISDAPYLACALAIKVDFIWTDDKDFSVQDIIPIKNTKQFIHDQKK